jgi:hypothetical protein
MRAAAGLPRSASIRTIVLRTIAPLTGHWPVRALPTYPPGWIVVPHVAGVRNRTQRHLERADTVQLIERVAACVLAQSHGYKIAHY